MKLYLISQTEVQGFDTYDSAVVCANTEEDAKNIHPNGGVAGDSYIEWCSPAAVTVKYLGQAEGNLAAGVVCASFNAG